MIQYKSGDIFAENTEAIVNPVNCVGVMGAGLALSFKKRYKDNYAAYREACRKQEVQPGVPLVFTKNTKQIHRYIINFPTKYHWRDKSRIEDIDAGLVALKSIILELAITSIAIPALGCGYGGLLWENVQVLIELRLSSLDNVSIIVFRPL